jgi:protein TonB
MVGFIHLQPSSDQTPEQPVPIFFEIVEEALPSTPDEQSGTVPMPPKETVPEEMPEDVGTVPENMGMVPENMGTVPENVETIPEDMPEDMGTDPIENTENEKISDAKAEETVNDKEESVEQARVMSAPVALNKIIPVYPRSARRRGHEGCVTVEISVAEDGHVSGAEIVSSSGHAELDSAALGAVRTAKFAPATEDGASVTGRLRLTFNFKLE